MDPTRRPRLMDQVRRALRVKRYSIRTEKTYCYWTRFFIRYSGARHPLEMGETEVRTFLEYLAVERKVAAATQNQALNASLFLYGQVLERPLGDIGPVTRAKRPRQLPTVQELMGHRSVETTQIYTHVPGSAFGGARSPLG